MKKRLWKPILLLGLFLFTVIACGISFNNEDEKSSQEDIEFQLTREALQRTQTAEAAPPAASEQQPKDAQTDQESDSEADDSDDDDDIPCNSSKFVSETIPDGTVYQAGDTFTKSWTIRNAGDCDWTTEYKFVFEEGDQMDGLTSMKLPSVIEPGETITFNIDLTAPSAAGDYVGVWRLKAVDGEKLGKYWVKITVGPAGPPPAAFAVTSLSTNLADINPCGCPYTYPVDVSIVTNAAGQVTYQTEQSDTGLGASKSMTFDAAETKILEFDWNGLTTGAYWLKVNIISPNNQVFGPFNFNVTCP